MWDTSFNFSLCLRELKPSFPRRMLCNSRFSSGKVTCCPGCSCKEGDRKSRILLRILPRSALASSPTLMMLENGAQELIKETVTALREIQNVPWSSGVCAAMQSQTFYRFMHVLNITRTISPFSFRVTLCNSRSQRNASGGSASQSFSTK